MAIRTKEGKYKCSICKKEYSYSHDADACRDAHDNIVYVPLLRKDLNRLLQFIYTKEDELLTESLITTLQNYNRINP